MLSHNVQSNGKSAEIRLSYYKQGDDLKSSYVRRSNGKINIVATIDAHVGLLQSAIEQLEGIKQIYIKQKPRHVSIDGNAHFISISGPNHFINTLLKNSLAKKDPFDSTASDEELSDMMSDIDVQYVMDDLIKQSFEDDDDILAPDTCIGSEMIHNELKNNKEL